MLFEKEIIVEFDKFDIEEYVDECSDYDLEILAQRVLGELDNRNMYLELIVDEVTENWETIIAQLPDSLKAEIGAQIIKDLSEMNIEKTTKDKIEAIYEVLIDLM